VDKAISVSAVDDTDCEGTHTLTVSMEIDDPQGVFPSTFPDLFVTITDNDIRLEMQPPGISGVLAATESGSQTPVLMVRMTCVPAVPTVFALENLVQLDAAAVTFTAGDWNVYVKGKIWIGQVRIRASVSTQLFEMYTNHHQQKKKKNTNIKSHVCVCVCVPPRSYQPLSVRATDDLWEEPDIQPASADIVARAPGFPLFDGTAMGTVTATVADNDITGIIYVPPVGVWAEALVIREGQSAEWVKN
jgi:hypothetical protein